MVKNWILDRRSALSNSVIRNPTPNVGCIHPVWCPHMQSELFVEHRYSGFKPRHGCSFFLPFDMLWISVGLGLHLKTWKILDFSLSADLDRTRFWVWFSLRKVKLWWNRPDGSVGKGQERYRYLRVSCSSPGMTEYFFLALWHLLVNRSRKISHSADLDRNKRCRANITM